MSCVSELVLETREVMTHELQFNSVWMTEYEPLHLYKYICITQVYSLKFMLFFLLQFEMLLGKMEPDGTRRVSVEKTVTSVFFIEKKIVVEH